MSYELLPIQGSIMYHFWWIVFFTENPVKRSLFKSKWIDSNIIWKSHIPVFQNSQRNTCARDSFLIHRCFSVNFAKFLSTAFFHRTASFFSQATSNVWILNLMFFFKWCIIIFINIRKYYRMQEIQKKNMLFILDYQTFKSATLIVIHEDQMKELAFDFHYRSEGDPFKEV